MTATNHGLMGALIAVTLHRYPFIAVPLAFFSHFLLDSLPHFGDKHMDLHSKRFFRILKRDITLAVVSTLLVAYAWHEIALLVVVYAFIAASPDIASFYYVYLKPQAKKLPLSRFHKWIQWSETPKGLVVEALWFFILFPGLIYFGVR